MSARVDTTVGSTALPLANCPASVRGLCYLCLFVKGVLCACLSHSLTHVYSYLLALINTRRRSSSIVGVPLICEELGLVPVLFSDDCFLSIESPLECLWKVQKI